MGQEFAATKDLKQSFLVRKMREISLKASQHSSQMVMLELQGHLVRCGAEESLNVEVQGGEQEEIIHALGNVIYN